MKEEMVTLGEVVTPRREKGLPSENPELPYIGLEHVEAHTMRILGTVPAGTMRSNANRFFAGDVLYSRLRPYLNKVCMPAFDGYCSAEFIVFPKIEGVDSTFLKYRLNAQDFLSFANHLNAGDRPRVDFDQLSSFAFFLPSSLSQRRIVGMIEELFSKLDSGLENLKTAQAQLKVYRQALLKHAFAGKELVQKGIIAKPFGEEYFLTLGDVIQTLGQGWSPRCLETPSKSDDVWGVIRTTAIQPLHFNDTKNKQLPIGLTPRPHLEIIPGDVLITRAGPRTRVGIACYVKNTRPKLMVCDKAYRLQVHKEKILPQYLVMLLNTSEVLSELEKLKSGISDSGLNLTQAKFLTLKIVVPSLEHQQFILDDIEEKLTNVAFLESQIDDSLQQAEALRQSILKKAFAGLLVPQDPSDLPAPRPGKWFVYVLECEDGSLYKGHSQDVVERWKQHATGHGAEWTSTHPPKRLVHWEEFDSQQAAVSREKDLKTGYGREWLAREIKAGRTRQAGEPASVLLARIKAENMRHTEKSKKSISRAMQNE